MIKIEIANQAKARVKSGEAQRAARAVVSKLRLKTDWQVSLAIVGDQAIKDLNRKYRAKDKITDVLSFEGGKDNFNLPGQLKYLGEIIIDYPQAKRQAKKTGWPVKKEFAFLLIHGLLHLLGYDHEKSRAEEKKMEKLEKEILAKLSIKVL